MQVVVTETAINKLTEGGVGGETFLRLGVQQGGCAGLSYSKRAQNHISSY